MIFLAYSREDSATAAGLARELSAAGYPLYRDPTLVEGDPFWRETIARQIATADALLIVWSCHAAASPWVEEEIRAATGPCIYVALDATPGLPHLASPDRADQVRWVPPREVGALVQRLIRPGGEPPPAALADPAAIGAARRALAATQAERLAALLARLPRRTDLRAGTDEIINPEDGSPLRRVDGRACYLGIGPVTNAQYRRFVEETGFPPAPTWGRAEYTRPTAPVTGVNWFEARAYAAWAGGDLPDEAEWVQAAGGAAGPEYATATGRISPELAHYGWPLGDGGPVPAGAYPASRTGFVGMCGNTWDWCAAAWDDHRVIRGGGWMDAPLFCQIATRYRNAPVDRDCCVGFRIKRAVTTA